MTLTAAAGAMAGTYNLTIRGAGTGITDATLPLVLKVNQRLGTAAGLEKPDTVTRARLLLIR